MTLSSVRRAMAANNNSGFRIAKLNNPSGIGNDKPGGLDLLRIEQLGIESVINQFYIGIILFKYLHVPRRYGRDTIRYLQSVIPLSK